MQRTRGQNSRSKQHSATMPGGWDGIGVAPELLQAVNELSWPFPRDVQDEAIPLILGGGDVMVAAATGSGKTGAFGIPIVQTILEQRRYESRPAPKIDESALKAAEAAKSLMLSPHDRDPILKVSDDGLSCRTDHPKFWGGVRANKSVKGGKYFYEVEIGKGLGRVGFSTAAATLELGIDDSGFGYGGTAKKSNSRRFDPYGEKYGDGDVLGCYVDLEQKEISFSRNGNFLGVAFKLPKTFNDPLFPALCLKAAEMKVNFGATPFKHPPQQPGFKAFSQVNPDHWATVADNTRLRRGGSAGGKAGRKTPVAIIIAPTKELAKQIHSDILTFTEFCKDPAIESVLLMGGVNFKAAAATLQKGCDIVVGTPSSVLDFAKSKKLDVRNVSTFCLDEADQLCGFDTLKMVMALYNLLPRGGAGMDRLQVCFFSATLHSREISQLAQRICHNPTWVDLKGEDTVPDTVRVMCRHGNLRLYCVPDSIMLFCCSGASRVY